MTATAALRRSADRATRVHSTAEVDGRAQLGSGVRIGPFCIVGPDVDLGDGSELLSHVVVTGHTSVGARARISPFAAIGHAPQDSGYRGEPTALLIGQDCFISEGVTIHSGTPTGRGQTVIGDRCSFLAQSHVAHDSQVGSDVTVTNSAMIAGHCQVGDHAVLGEGAGLHQFVRVGAHAFVGEFSAVLHDVIPYGMVSGNRAHLRGLNIAGLHRHGFSTEQVHDLRRVYRLLFADEGTLAERIADVSGDFADHPTVQEILAFIRSGTDRAFCTPVQAPLGM